LPVEKCHNLDLLLFSANLDMNRKRKRENSRRKVLVNASSNLEFDALLHF
jgi:hypothetical protein